MINVLHVSDKMTTGESTLNGVTSLFALWLPRFDPNRVRVSLCVLGSADKGCEYLKDRGIEIRCLNKSKFDPLALPALCRVIRERQIDLLHVHGYRASTFGRLAGVLCRIPVVVHEHMNDPVIPVYQRLADRLLSPLTAMGLAVSEPVKTFMVRQRFMPASRVKVVVPGICLEDYPEQIEKEKSVLEDAPPENPFEKPERVVGIVGRLDPVKGHRFFLQAAQQVIAHNVPVRFLVVGDGGLRPELEQYAESLALTSHLTFLGHCDDMPGIYQNIDVLVIASDREGMPGTLLEGLAGYCAIVSTDTIGLRTVFEGETPVRFVPARDANAMAAEIIDLLGDDAGLRRLQSAARELVEKLDVSKTVAELQRCYEVLVRAGVGRGSARKRNAAALQ